MKLAHLIRHITICLSLTIVLLASNSIVYSQPSLPVAMDSLRARWAIRLDLVGMLLHFDYRYARFSLEGEYRFSGSRRWAITFDPEFISYNERGDDTIPQFQMGPSLIYQHHLGFNFGLRYYARPLDKRLNYWVEPQIGLGIGYAQLMPWASPLFERRVTHAYPSARLRAGTCLRLGKAATFGISVDGYARKYYGLPKQELRLAPELNVGIEF